LLENLHTRRRWQRSVKKNAIAGILATSFFAMCEKPCTPHQNATSPEMRAKWSARLRQHSDRLDSRIKSGYCFEEAKVRERAQR
jgi:hypothetical protein